MKTIILDRSEYDVFFRVRAPGENRKRERKHFIAEHSPYENAAASADFSQCRIRGKSYDMITVMRNDRLRKMEKSRCVSQTAILVNLYGESDFRSVQCGNEYLILAGEAVSIHTGFQDDALPAADMHIEKSDLRTKNAKAGHLFASRHRNRRAVAIGFFLLAACVSAIPLQYANVSEKREKAETALKKNQEEPVAIRGYSFWQLFEGQIKAIRESEGHIDKYTFDRNATPQTTIQLTDANPELLEERMERDDRCAKFRFGDILFSGGSQRFSLSIESAVRKETGNTAARYQDIVRFSDFIAAQEGIAESIRMNKQPRYAYRLESSRLACFIHALREFCLDNGIIPAVLSIALDRSSGTCMLTTELAYGTAEDDPPSAFPTQGEIAEAFLPRNDRDRIVPSRGTTNREPDGVLVGMIAFNGKKVTFDRKKDGKISVNRTGNEE